MKFNISKEVVEPARKNIFALRITFALDDDSDSLRDFDEYSDKEIKEVLHPDKEYMKKLISFLLMNTLHSIHPGEFDLTPNDEDRYEKDMSEFYNEKIFPTRTFNKCKLIGAAMSYELKFYDSNGCCHNVEIENIDKNLYRKYKLKTNWWDEEDEV